METPKDIEQATTAITTDGRPDSKARRYDRQLRLWAATGQAALESARLLVLSSSATSTSVLKNLVLPGVGSFTILDAALTTPEDAGNNFFLEADESVGKPRAEEAVRLLCELNDGVQGHAEVRSLEDVLQKEESGERWLRSFSLVIAHNVEPALLERVSKLLWEEGEDAPPLVVVRSAGFLAEFYIQFKEHAIIESHSENAPSLRIDKPFPALKEYSLSLDLENMDPTDHGHVPYVIILVRAIEDWKKSHDGKPPSTYPEKQEFKKLVLGMKHKIDEENFDEAASQVYRAYTATTVPSEVRALFSDPKVQNLSSDTPVFFHLVAALKKFVESQEHGCLPLTSTLPDMKASTGAYIELQKMYKAQAEKEKEVLKGFIQPGVPVDDALVDTFVKNVHGIKVLRGKRWGWLDEDKEALVNAIQVSPKQFSIHLSLSALSSIAKKQQPGAPFSPSVDELAAEAQALLPAGTELPDEFGDAVGEVARAPTADLPNTAAFLGGLVAQEVIKVITTQYVPIDTYCEIDLIDTWTGML